MLTKENILARNILTKENILTRKILTRNILAKEITKMTNDGEYTDEDAASALPAPPLVQQPLLH